VHVTDAYSFPGPLSTTARLRSLPLYIGLQLASGHPANRLPELLPWN
jgi:hypothetical protein